MRERLLRDTLCRKERAVAQNWQRLLHSRTGISRWVGTSHLETPQTAPRGLLLHAGASGQECCLRRRSAGVSSGLRCRCGQDRPCMLRSLRYTAGPSSLCRTHRGNRTQSVRHQVRVADAECQWSRGCAEGAVAKALWASDESPGDEHHVQDEASGCDLNCRKPTKPKKEIRNDNVDVDLFAGERSQDVRALKNTGAEIRDELHESRSSAGVTPSNTKNLAVGDGRFRLGDHSCKS